MTGNNQVYTKLIPHKFVPFQDLTNFINSHGNSTDLDSLLSSQKNGLSGEVGIFWLSFFQFEGEYSAGVDKKLKGWFRVSNFDKHY